MEAKWGGRPLRRQVRSAAVPQLGVAGLTPGVRCPGASRRPKVCADPRGRELGQESRRSGARVYEPDLARRAHLVGDSNPVPRMHTLAR